MAKWDVWAAVVGSKYMGQVEAETEEEAQALGNKLDSHIGLCHQCSDEAEGLEVQDISVERA